MSIDTRNQRMSLIGIGSPVPSVLPDPNSSIGLGDRFQLLYLYPRLASGAITLELNSIITTSVSVPSLITQTVSKNSSITQTVSVDSQIET